ncbi:unnamed protein product [Sphagnum troendelagicum]|uniref:Uncharacterized protein n=1 Tax=Sphagnum troendelagicum TaxID=128251 RepID=A0ABP0UTJ3_9BRYO
MEKLGACPSKPVDMSRDDGQVCGHMQGKPERASACVRDQPEHWRQENNFGYEQGGLLGIELERAEGALLLHDGEILAPDRELVSGCWKHTSWKPQVEQQESWKR